MERAKQLALDGLSEIMAHSSKPELSSSAHVATAMAAHVTRKRKCGAPAEEL